VQLCYVCVCVCLLLQDLVQSCVRGEGGYWGTCATRDDEPRGLCLPVCPSVCVHHGVLALVCVCLLLQDRVCVDVCLLLQYLFLNRYCSCVLMCVYYCSTYFLQYLFSCSRGGILKLRVCVNYCRTRTTRLIEPIRQKNRMFPSKK
jgi:hypothetical protein